MNVPRLNNDMEDASSHEVQQITQEFLMHEFDEIFRKCGSVVKRHEDLWIFHVVDNRVVAFVRTRHQRRLSHIGFTDCEFSGQHTTLQNRHVSYYANTRCLI